MKLLIIFAAVVAVAIAEHCTTAGDCTVTSCANGGTITCSTNNECVCPAPGGSQGSTCSVKSDCDGMSCGHHNHHDHGANHEGHCVDSHCRCSLQGGPGNHPPGPDGHNQPGNNHH